MTKSPFDHRRDAELGDALREALASDDDLTFVQRVLAKLATVEGPVATGAEWWEILSGWARPGLAVAAVALVAGLVFWMSGVRAQPDTPSPIDPLLSLAEAGVPTALLLSTAQPPDLDYVLASGLGNGR